MTTHDAPLHLRATHRQIRAARLAGAEQLGVRSGSWRLEIPRDAVEPLIARLEATCPRHAGLARAWHNLIQSLCTLKK